MSSQIAVDGSFAIYSHELKQWKADSKRALASRGKPRRNLIKGHLASILNRLTLANSSISVLALLALPVIVHAYA